MSLDNYGLALMEKELKRIKGLKKGPRNAQRISELKSAISDLKKLYKRRARSRTNVEDNVLINLMSSGDELLKDKCNLLAFQFHKLFRKNMTATGINKTKHLDNAKLKVWANVFRLMMEEDERTIEEIRAVYVLIEQDSFWKKVIQSPAKMREKFEQLFLTAKSKGHDKAAKSRSQRVREESEQSDENFISAVRGKLHKR